MLFNNFRHKRGTFFAHFFKKLEAGRHYCRPKSLIFGEKWGRKPSLILLFKFTKVIISVMSSLVRRDIIRQEVTGPLKNKQVPCVVHVVYYMQFMYQLRILLQKNCRNNFSKVLVNSGGNSRVLPTLKPDKMYF